jgi:hypothetical protein
MAVFFGYLHFLCGFSSDKNSLSDANAVRLVFQISFKTYFCAMCLLS